MDLSITDMETWILDPPHTSLSLLFSEKFASVTILFSDIVTFTNIAAAVQPIDIVNMLNELYSKFDKCTNDNGVYKVGHLHT